MVVLRLVCDHSLMGGMAPGGGRREREGRSKLGGLGGRCWARRVGWFCSLRVLVSCFLFLIACVFFGAGFGLVSLSTEACMGWRRQDEMCTCRRMEGGGLKRNPLKGVGWWVTVGKGGTAARLLSDRPPPVSQVRLGTRERDMHVNLENLIPPRRYLHPSS